MIYIEFYQVKTSELLTIKLGNCIILTIELGSGGRMMDKKDILEKAQKSKTDFDERELQIISKAGYYAMSSGIIVSSILTIIDIVF